jgi:GH15 family glucan-1,4-alpha-glucosidase
MRSGKREHRIFEETDNVAAPDCSYDPIEDYAIIGDCSCAALVSRRGSIDWLCLPHFDSPPLFCAMLDARKGGRFRISPSPPFSSSRRYIPESNVLETTFENEQGKVRLSDLMPIYSPEGRSILLCPERHILRVVECLEGEPEVEILYEPRPNFGRHVPSLSQRGRFSWFFQDGSNAYLLQTDVPMTISEDRSSVYALHRLQRGDRRAFSLCFAAKEPLVLFPLGGPAFELIDTTAQWWRNWLEKCRYRGPYRNEVLRSALVLKLLTFAPSGAVVASCTTSLPEKIGGIRNWDYRYCWLRDASMTFRAFFRLGFMSEGQAFLSWLLHTTRLTQPELQVLYGVYGEPDLKESELEHLEGYRCSRPVRVGNLVTHQLQLDTYGVVVEAAWEYVQQNGKIGRATGKTLAGFGRTVCRKWREPDEGIWEIRSGKRHNTHSKVLCWVALDRLIRMHEQGRLRIPLDRFTREREEIRKEIEERGYDEEIRSYVTAFDYHDVDASLLLLTEYGYRDPRHPRMVGTYRRIRERLHHGGLFYRYDPDAHEDGLPPGEGMFLMVSFWEVAHRARLGEVEGARRDFEKALSYANDLGLFGEETDRDTKTLLGNFPQAYTHIGLIEAALAISEAEGTDTPPDQAPEMEGE